MPVLIDPGGGLAESVSRHSIRLSLESSVLPLVVLRLVKFLEKGLVRGTSHGAGLYFI